MTWELYEVWGLNEDEQEELIDTTKDLKKARILARESLRDGYTECTIYKETEDGDVKAVEVVK